MRIFGLTITRKALAPVTDSRGWSPLIREPFAGAWQMNAEVRIDTVLANPTIFACMTLIAGDISKLRIKLMEYATSGVWQETRSNAYSPVLRKPNRYQTRGQFVESWILSKLSRGNTYVLKQRDNRGVVTSLYVLDPSRVKPLVSEDGAVYYELQPDTLTASVEAITVPASEVIHDRYNCLFQPLVGLSPIFAAGLAAMQGYQIVNGSTLFFKNRSMPSGILIAPGPISDETATRLKEHWETNYTGNGAGKIVVIGDGLKFEPMGMTAVDAQLVDQLKWSDEVIARTFHIPPYKIGLEQTPVASNVQALNVEYYSRALQKLIEDAEACLDDIVASCNFVCLFTCVPIYWLIERCNFGQNGNRIGGTQEFRIFEAWCTNGNFPINDNVVRDTKHYNCAAGATFDAAYTVRCGRSWIFEGCKAESFPSACIFDARSVGQVAWLNGWIEWVSHPALFKCAIDNTAPFSIPGSPIRIAGPTIYFGDATTQYLVQNVNGIVSLRDINMTGVVAQVRAASDPRQMVEPVNIYGAQPAFWNNVQPQGRSLLQRITPWRNGVPQDMVNLTSTGSPPTKAAVVSDLSGATTTAITAGNEMQAGSVQIPLALMQPLEGGWATFVLVGRFLSSPPTNGWARAVRWANQTSPTYANIAGGAPDIERITGTRLSVSAFSSYIPTGLTSYHIGVQFAPETNGATFQIEGLYVLSGDQVVQYPFLT